MKYTTRLIYIVSFLLISFNTQKTVSQGLAQNIVDRPSSKSHSMFNRTIVENGILGNGKYTYEFKNKNILVEIKDDLYYEYHPEKEYIKAKIDWLSEYKYQLTIVDIQKKGTPLKIGSKLTSRIVKIEGNEYFYTSILNKKTGKGSFKKVN